VHHDDRIAPRSLRRDTDLDIHLVRHIAPAVDHGGLAADIEVAVARERERLVLSRRAARDRQRQNGRQGRDRAAPARPVASQRHVRILLFGAV
jgi:hypothetical protein